MAQEVKRQADLKAAAMTTEDLQLCLKLSIQYHSIYVAACAVYVLSRCNMLNGPLLKVQKVPLISNSDGE